MNQGETTSVEVLANDSDSDGTLVSSSVTVDSQPSNGTATANTDGTIDYTHDGSDATSDSFTYTVEDDDGATSDPATVTVSIDLTTQSQYVDHDLARIEAEDFDTGGEGVAYHDTGSDNQGGAYRATAVDIEPTEDTTGSYNVGWINGGEWWEYTLEVPADGEYALSARLAGNNATTLDVAVDGSQTATIDVPDTGGWQDWTTVEAGTVTLATGTHTIRLTANGDSFNINWFGLDRNQTPTVSDDSLSVRQGETATVEVLANDSDSDGSLVSSGVTVDSQPSNGTATANTDGTIDYTHDGSDATSDSFTYTVEDDDGATSEGATVSVSVELPTQSPYVDHDLARIEAEDFDTGGEGVAYHDTGSENQGNEYRDTGVDIQRTEDTTGSYNVGWINGGEWWEYTVEVPADGEYALSARLAGNNATTLDVAVDGSQTATIDVPDTGGWQDWTTVEAGTVTLSAGTHTIRLTANGDDFNINWFSFDRNQAPTVSDDSLSVGQGETATVEVLANDSDSDGSLVSSSVTVDSQPSNGTATANTDGTIDYTHDGSDSTSDSFTYTVEDDDGTISDSATVTVSIDLNAQSPYVDHDLAQIEAEDFDTGGEGVAYHDTGSDNQGGAYRDTAVDIEPTEDTTGSYNVGWINGGEWWEYTVEVPADGEYALSARLAGNNATTLDVAVDGSQTATIDVPDTGGWQDWTTVEAGTITLSAGTHTIRFTANGNDFNINWFSLE